MFPRLITSNAARCLQTRYALLLGLKHFYDSILWTAAEIIPRFFLAVLNQLHSSIGCTKENPDFRMGNPGPLHYGSVEWLCESLGYASTLKTSQRYYKGFRRRVFEFRKSFVKTRAERNPAMLDVQFPLDYKSPVFRSSVLEFLDDSLRQDLFQDSEEAQIFGWPIRSQQDVQ